MHEKLSSQAALGLEHVLRGRTKEELLLKDFRRRQDLLTLQGQEIDALKKRADTEIDDGEVDTQDAWYFGCLTFLAGAENVFQRVVLDKQLRKRIDYGGKFTFEYLNPAGKQYLDEIDRKIEDISLSDLFNNGQEIASKNPVKLYRHYLTRAYELDESEPDSKTVQVSQAEDLFPVSYLYLPYINDEVLARIIDRQPDVKPYMVQTTKSLRRAFAHAERQTRNILYKPQDREYPSLEALIQQVLSEGSSLKKTHMLEDLLGTHDQAASWTSYRRLSDVITSGRGSELHEELKDIVSESYEGLVGEEIVEVGIPRPDEPIQVKEEKEKIFKMRAELFKLLPGIEGSIEINGNHEHPTFEHPAKFFEYQRKNDGNIIVLGFEWKDELEQSQRLLLQLDRSKHIDWSLLRLPEELPELYETMIWNASQMMCQVLEERRPQRVKSSEAPKSNGKRIHYHDEVYALKKIKDSVGEKGIVFQAESEQQPDTTPTGPKIEIDCDFIARLEKKLPKEAERLKNLLTRKKRIKQLFFKGPDGQKRYAIRDGDYRVILEEREVLKVVSEETGEQELTRILCAIDYGDRERIYSKYMPSKTA